MEALPFNITFLHPRFWLTWLGLGLWWLVGQLPYRCLLWFGKGAGVLFYKLGRSRRHIVECNLALCFPDMSVSDRTALAKKNFENYGIALFEVPMAWWWSDRRFGRMIDLQGLENIENLNGQGALLMALHYTTLEVGGQAINRVTVTDAMYRPHNNAVYNYVQRKARVGRNSGSEVYPRKDVRGTMKALRKGRVIWYAPDQDYGRTQSVFAPFFGVQAASVTATAKFAQAGKAKVLPFTHVRLPGAAGYKVVIHPPLDNFPSGNDEVDAARINQVVETFIREQPDQYLWAHRRFKTRPPGEPSFYK